MKTNKALIIILIFTLLIRLNFAFAWHETWWDSGVYVGMGKYIYSGGEHGLWEHIRPPLLPLALGFFWKLGLDPLLFGRLLEIILMTGIVYLTYLLAKYWFSENVALLAALIISFSPIFYYLSFHQYTEIPSTFLILLALWLNIKSKPFIAGITVGLAFLTKFPAGMFLAIIGIALFYQKQLRALFYLTAGFALPLVPYFVYNIIVYSNPLTTLLAAQDAISRALGCNVLRAQPWWQYGTWLVFSETKLHLFTLPGIYALAKQWQKKHLVYLLGLIIPLLYFMQLHCRDYRYLTLFLPFIAILTALGFIWTYNKLNIDKKYFLFILTILGIILLHSTMLFYHGNELKQPTIAQEYYQYFEDKQITGELWVSNPIVAAYTNIPVNKMYYPIYDKQVSQDFSDYLSQHPKRISAVMLDNCGGGIICSPEDNTCKQQTEQLITQLDNQYIRTFDKQHGRCWYRIWTTS